VFDAPGAIPAAVDPDHWDINRLQRAVMRLRCDGKTIVRGPGEELTT
jgi:hypothetical protein